MCPPNPSYSVISAESTLPRELFPRQTPRQADWTGRGKPMVVGCKHQRRCKSQNCRYPRSDPRSHRNCDGLESRKRWCLMMSTVLLVKEAAFEAAFAAAGSLVQCNVLREDSILSVAHHPREGHSIRTAKDMIPESSRSLHDCIGGTVGIVSRWAHLGSWRRGHCCWRIMGVPGRVSHSRRENIGRKSGIASSFGDSRSE